VSPRADLAIVEPPLDLGDVCAQRGSGRAARSKAGLESAVVEQG